MITSPRMRARENRIDSLVDTPTQDVPVIQMSKNTRPLLPLDSQSRPYVCLTNPGEYTLNLVYAAVERYIALQKCAPNFILLSGLRYLAYGLPMKFYYRPGLRPIPFAHEEGASYDVLVRGEPFDGN